ncbi:hypothetical protein PIIN_04763 [Serendipita indica DSM 11827]|uniref:Methyltransferase domain-containing protein n=1 Tax=Serendipita indica (strain DSM 11827) TaxID=1109443 RepID=G4THN5_SERID|nr:hypothetical protein PIIN_04763 [Serendipita indica DSM 11827]
MSSYLPDLNPTTTGRVHGSDTKRQSREERAEDIQDQRAKYEQSMFGVSSNGDRTFSHVRTNVPVNSESEAGLNRNEEGSFYSYNSTRDVRLFVKEMHGRIWNSMNETYLLPSDDMEWNRLDKQHLAHLIGLGGLYPCAEQVEAVLAPVEGTTKRILDVGCGTGSWILEMAERFPHALAMGVDLAPTPFDTSLFPSNLRIEIDDINLGLSHFYGQFDLVHMRCVLGGIQNIDKTLADLFLCLNPGGMLIIVDGGSHFLSDPGTIGRMRRVHGDEADATATSEDGSWLNRLHWEASQGCKIAGASVDRSQEVLSGGLWDQSLCEQESVASGSYFLPIGPWAQGNNVAQTQQLHYGGLLMRQSLMSIHRAFHSILLRHGMTQDVLDAWSQEIDQELNTSRCKSWVRFHFNVARRRLEQDSTPGVNSERSLPRIEPRPRDENSYPAFEIFYDKETARATAAKREETIGKLPTACVVRAWLQNQAL